MEAKKRRKKRYIRHKRVRGKVFGTAKRPRLCVFRSSKHIYAQLIDDEKSKTLASAADVKLKITKGKKQKTESKKKVAEEKELSGKSVLAYGVGRLIAKKAKELKINEVVFDRGGYKYHGRVKALAEGARKEGLKI
ncbi:MAG: 50S ribosomal protein L18 [Patescibacteria group bacterium]|nr:50S ribosomal protein L18 [Patescibacteria group bacterium]